MLRSPRETPIERIFREVMRQKMSLAIEGHFTAQTECSKFKSPTKPSSLARSVHNWHYMPMVYTMMNLGEMWNSFKGSRIPTGTFEMPPLTRGRGWIIAAGILAALFVAVLGPGLKFHAGN
jgi:hypothetical protein